MDLGSLRVLVLANERLGHRNTLEVRKRRTTLSRDGIDIGEHLGIEPIADYEPSEHS